MFNCAIMCLLKSAIIYLLRWLLKWFSLNLIHSKEPITLFNYKKVGIISKLIVNNGGKMFMFFSLIKLK